MSSRRRQKRTKPIPTPIPPTRWQIAKKWTARAIAFVVITAVAAAIAEGVARTIDAFPSTVQPDATQTVPDSGIHGG